MLYNEKELTSQEVLDLLAEKDRQLAEHSEKIKKLEEAGKATPTVETPAEAPAQETPAETAPVVNSEGEETQPEGTQEGETKAMSEDQAKKLKEVEDQNKTLAEENMQLKEANRKAVAEKKLNEYKEKGVVPAILEKAKEIVLADTGSQQVYTFSEDSKEVKKSLSECVYSLLDSLQGIKLGEATDTTPTGDADVAGANTSNDAQEAIKQYMETNKVSYLTAYHKLLSEGKIEELKVINS